MATTAGAKLVLTSVTVAATGPPAGGESDDPDADWTGMFWTDEQAAVAARAIVAAISVSR
jgi:hypothetical protein